MSSGRTSREATSSGSAAPWWALMASSVAPRWASSGAPSLPAETCFRDRRERAPCRARTASARGLPTTDRWRGDSWSSLDRARQPRSVLGAGARVDFSSALLRELGLGASTAFRIRRRRQGRGASRTGGSAHRAGLLGPRWRGVFRPRIDSPAIHGRAWTGRVDRVRFRRRRQRRLSRRRCSASADRARRPRAVSKTASASASRARCSASPRRCWLRLDALRLLFVLARLLLPRARSRRAVRIKSGRLCRVSHVIR